MISNEEAERLILKATLHYRARKCNHITHDSRWWSFKAWLKISKDLPFVWSPAAIAEYWNQKDYDALLIPIPKSATQDLDPEIITWALYLHR